MIRPRVGGRQFLTRKCAVPFSDHSVSHLRIELHLHRDYFTYSDDSQWLALNELIDATRYAASNGKDSKIKTSSFDGPV
jgi:hypothetical protein